eukprot:6460014-Amphidinium_carterae.1
MRQSFTEEVIAVPIGAASWSFYSDPKYVVVLCNYSDIKATLWSKRDSKHAHTVSLAGHFRLQVNTGKEGQALVSPPCKRQKIGGSSPPDALATPEEHVECTPEAAGACPADLSSSPIGDREQHECHGGLVTPAKTKMVSVQPVGYSVDETKLELPSPGK